MALFPTREKWNLLFRNPASSQTPTDQPVSACRHRGPLSFCLPGAPPRLALQGTTPIDPGFPAALLSSFPPFSKEPFSTGLIRVPHCLEESPNPHTWHMTSPCSLPPPPPASRDLVPQRQQVPSGSLNETPYSALSGVYFVYPIPSLLNALAITPELFPSQGF